MIKINMSIARDVHRDLIREARTASFQRLDVEYQIALEKGDKELQEAIAKQKQELRDMPANASIDNAKTTEDLSKFWPDLLGPKTV